MLGDSLLNTPTIPPSPPPQPPLRGGILLEEDAIFDKPHAPPSPTTARVLAGNGLHATSSYHNSDQSRKSSTRTCRSSSNNNSSSSSSNSGSNHGNGRPGSPQQRDYRPFPITRPVQHRLLLNHKTTAATSTTASNKLEAAAAAATNRRIRPISPMMQPSRSNNAVPPHVQLALEYLKEDLERTQHELRLHQQQKQNAEYGPDHKTEIFIDSLLQEELIKPVRRARVHEEMYQQQQQHRSPRDTTTNRGSSSPSLSWESNSSGVLKTSYPLKRKDAKKRKEARFRVSNNGRVTPVSPMGRTPRRHHPHPSHRLLSRTYHQPGISHHGEVFSGSHNDDDEDHGSIITPPLQHLRRLKRERDSKYRTAKTPGRRSATSKTPVTASTSKNRNNKTVSAEQLVENFVDAFSCHAVDNVLAAAQDRCAPFGNNFDVTEEDDPSIITLEDNDTVETAEYESDTAVVLKSSNRKNTTSSSRIASVNDPSVSTQPAVAELLKLRKELNQLHRMSSLQSQQQQLLLQQQQQQQQQQAFENDHRRYRDDDEDSLITKEQIHITVTKSASPTKAKPKKNVHFAAPCVTKIKHRPFTDPDEIEKLYFVSEELDEYEYDRETTDGEQFEVRLIDKQEKPLCRVDEDCVVNTAKEECPDDEKLGQHEQGDSFAVSVSYKNRPRLPFDPADDLMLSPSDLSALHQDSISLASTH